MKVGASPDANRMTMSLGHLKNGYLIIMLVSALLSGLVSARNCPSALPTAAYATKCTGNSIEVDKKVFNDCPRNERRQHAICEEIVRLVDTLRCDVGDHVRVTSGYRSQTHNDYSWAFVVANGGDRKTVSLTSKHMTGKAVDFYIDDFSYDQLLTIEKKLHKWAGYLDKPLRGSRSKIWTKVYKRNEGRDPDNSHDRPYIHVEWRP